MNATGGTGQVGRETLENMSKGPKPSNTQAHKPMKEILNKVALRRSLENRTSLHGSLRVHQLEFTVLDGPRVVQVVQSVVEAEVDAQGKIWAKLSEKEKRSHVQNKLAELAAAELMASERK